MSRGFPSLSSNFSGVFQTANTAGERELDLWRLDRALHQLGEPSEAGRSKLPFQVLLVLPLLHVAKTRPVPHLRCEMAADASGLSAHGDHQRVQRGKDRSRLRGRYLPLKGHLYRHVQAIACLPTE